MSLQESCRTWVSEIFDSHEQSRHRLHQGNFTTTGHQKDLNCPRKSPPCISKTRSMSSSLLSYVRSSSYHPCTFFSFSPPSVAIFLLSTATLFLLVFFPPSLDDLPGQQQPPWLLLISPSSSTTAFISPEARLAVDNAG